MRRSFSTPSCGDLLAGEVLRPHRRDLHGATPRAASASSPSNSTSTPTCGGRSGSAVQVGRHGPSRTADAAQLELLADGGGVPRRCVSARSCRGRARRPSTPRRRLGAARRSYATMSAAAAGTARSWRRSRSRSRARPCAPSRRAATRPLRGRALGALVDVLGALERRISAALSKSPSASLRAFLLSIIPAPVRSRSSSRQRR